MVQSRIKALERMQRIAPAHVDSPFEFSFAEPAKLPRPLLAMQQQSAGYGDRLLYENVNFTLPAAAGTFTVGGTVTGLAGDGFVLQLNGGNDMAMAVNGAFTFPTALAGGTGYAVTVSASPAHPAQTCAVTNGGGTLGAANVTNVSIACTTTPAATFTIGGSVSGLLGTGLALKLNGGAALPISADGTYVFPTALADASVYTVMISAQPTGPMPQPVAGGPGKSP